MLGNSEAEKIARSRLISLAVASGIFIAARAMFGDDEEQPDWLRFGHMTIDLPGGGGLKVRGSREYTFIPNLILGGIDAILSGETDSLKKAAYYEAEQRIPGDAGLVRTAINMYANYDPHFDRAIEPSYLQDRRKNDRV